jgi:hypothetical protein
MCWKVFSGTTPCSGVIFEEGGVGGSLPLEKLSPLAMTEQVPENCTR